MTALTNREPVLRPGLVSGLQIADARGTRIWVDERGAVSMTRRGGPPFEVAAPGSVTSVSVASADRIRPRRFTPAAQRGLVGLWSGADLLAAVNLVELGADRPYPDDVTLRATTGLDAFADRLGRAVEPASEEQVRRLRDLRQRDLVPLHDPADRKSWTAWVGALACLLAFLTWPAAPEGLGLVALPLAFAATVPPVLVLHRRRRRLLALVTSSPDPEGRVVVRPVPPTDLATRRIVESEVQVGAEEIVLRSAGSEWWLPGPARGGISQVSVSPESLTLEDRRGRPMVGLDPAVWGESTSGLLAELTRVGVAVKKTPLEDTRLVEALATRYDADRWVVLKGHQDASDNNAAAVLPLLATGLLGIGCALTAATDVVLGLVALVAWLPLAVVAWGSYAPWARWRRAQRRPAPARDLGGAVR